MHRLIVLLSYIFIIDLLLFCSTAEPMDEYPSAPASIAERYKVGRTLGDGNFAVVRECVERSTGREYALKIISKNKCRGKVRLPMHHHNNNNHHQTIKFSLIHCQEVVFCK